MCLFFCLGVDQRKMIRWIVVLSCTQIVLNDVFHCIFVFFGRVVSRVHFFHWILEVNSVNGELRMKLEKQWQTQSVEVGDSLGHSLWPQAIRNFLNVDLSHDLLALTGWQDMSQKKTHVKNWNHAINVMKERGTKNSSPSKSQAKSPQFEVTYWHRFSWCSEVSWDLFVGRVGSCAATTLSGVGASCLESPAGPISLDILFFLKIGSVIWIKPNRLCFPYAHKSHKGSCFVVFEIQCFSYTFHHLFLRQFAYPFVKKGAKPPKKRTFLHVEGLNLHRVTCWGRTSQAGWGRQSPPELCWAWGMDVEPLSRVERGGFRFFSTDVSQGVVRVSMVLCFMVQQEKSPRFSLSDVHGKAQLMKELEEFCTQKFIQAGFFAWIFSHTVCRVCRMYLCQSWKQFWASAFSGDPPGLGIFWDLSPCSGTGSSRKRIGRS